MKKYLAVHTEKSVYHDGVSHTLEAWESILKEMDVDFKFVKPFFLEESNYMEDE